MFSVLWQAGHQTFSKSSSATSTGCSLTTSLTRKWSTGLLITSKTSQMIVFFLSLLTGFKIKIFNFHFLKHERRSKRNGDKKLQPESWWKMFPANLTRCEPRISCHWCRNEENRGFPGLERYNVENEILWWAFCGWKWTQNGSRMQCNAVFWSVLRNYSRKIDSLFRNQLVWKLSGRSHGRICYWIHT